MKYLRLSSYYLAAFGMLAFIIFSSYLRGLFFDFQFYWIEEIILVVGFLFIILFFNEFKETFNNPILWLFLLIPALYGLNIFLAENQLYASQSFFRWLSVYLLFIVTVKLKEKDYMVSLIIHSLIFTAIWTSMFAWFNAFGIYSYKDAFLGSRLSSVFQYPNTFGVFISSIFLGMLLITTFDKKVRFTQYIYVPFFLYPLLITVFFTYSRGSWIILAIFIFLLLLLLKVRSQILYITNLLLLSLASYFSINHINKALVEQDIYLFLKLAILFSLGTGLVFILIQKLISKIKIKQIRYLNLVLPLLVLLIGISGLSILNNDKLIENLPNQLKERLLSIDLSSRSVSERSLFNIDANKLVKDNIIIGAGGGAWKQQYERYQSYPYNSTQTHNFYMQLLIEIGYTGLLLFILFLSLIFYSIWRKYKGLAEKEKNTILVVSSIILVLMSHSIIDFNMSYFYIQSIIFILLGVLVYPIDIPLKSFNSKALPILTISFVLTIVFLGAITVGKYLYAEKLTHSIVGMPRNEAVKTLDKAISLNPYEVNYRFEKIYQLMYSTKGISPEAKSEMLDEAQKLRKLNRKDPSFIMKLSQIYGQLGYVPNSILLLDEGIENGPWRENVYAQRITYSFSMAEYFKQEGNDLEVQKAFDRINDLNLQLQSKRSFLDTQPDSLRYPEFRIPPVVNLYVGKLLVIEQKYDKAEQYLLPLIKNKDQNIKRDALAWLIFSSQKQNKENKVKEYLELGKEIDVKQVLNEVYKIWY